MKSEPQVWDLLLFNMNVAYSHTASGAPPGHLQLDFFVLFYFDHQAVAGAVILY